MATGNPLNRPELSAGSPGWALGLGRAAEGQGARLDITVRAALAERLRATGQEVAIVAEAVGQLLRHTS